MTNVVLIASVTLFASFLCSLLEAALYTVTRSQLDVLEKRGVRGARRFKRFRSKIEEPIAAILTVNTIAHTVGAAICGGLVADLYGDTALGVFSAVFTVLVLALTEIVPKSVGVRYGRALVPVLAFPLQMLIWVSMPVARTSSYLMRKLTGSSDGSAPSEDEIIAMSRLAANAGKLTSLERVWVENALLLDRVAASDLLTPRTVVKYLAADLPLSELAPRVASLRNSRLPIVENDDLDRIVGVVYRRDLSDAIAGGSLDLTVRDLARPIEFVPETTKGPQLLDTFVRGKRHMLAVVDEYGGFEGIITLEDVLECLLGTEIVDEHDEHVDMQQYARERAAGRRRRAASRTGAEAQRGAQKGAEP